MPRFLAATLALAAALSAAPGHAEAERASFFVIDAIKADNGAIANGTLVAQRGSTAAVRELGATLVRDHTASKAEAIAAGSQVGVGTPTEMTAPARHLQRQLLRLSGPEFDRVFLKALIKDHRKAIAKYEEQRRSGEAVTRKLAEDVLPHLSQHLQVALSLQSGG
jgi:putative membrane protein